MNKLHTTRVIQNVNGASPAVVVDVCVFVEVVAGFVGVFVVVGEGFVGAFVVADGWFVCAFVVVGGGLVGVGFMPRSDLL